MSGGTSGVPSSGVDFTMLGELHLVTRDAKDADAGLMTTIFLNYFKEDETAKLLYNIDSIHELILEMIYEYIRGDDSTHVLVAEDTLTKTVVGWTAVSLVTSDQEDLFKYCDSVVWAGRQLLRRETPDPGEAPLHMDDMKRSGLITQLKNRNRDGQSSHAGGQMRMVVNTIAIHANVFEDERPDVAYKLIDHMRDLAKGWGFLLWAQVPTNPLCELRALFEEIGFDNVGSFELNLALFANEEHRSQRDWGFGTWTQWVLQIGNWEQGRRVSDELSD